MMFHYTNFLMPFCNWAENTSFGNLIKTNAWLFPFVEIFHLISLGLLGGAILTLNLRLLGLRYRRFSTAQLARDVQPWMIGSLVGMLVTGFFLFSSEAVRMHGNAAFRLKMIALPVAIIFTFTSYRKAVLSEDTAISPLKGRLIALTSLVLWAVVGLAGRAIGYVQ